MRSPLWNLMVRAAQENRVVVMHVTGLGPQPFEGVPTLPVGSNHVVLKDGTVVSLASVATARLRPLPGEVAADEEPF